MGKVALEKGQVALLEKHGNRIVVVQSCVGEKDYYNCTDARISGQQTPFRVSRADMTLVNSVADAFGIIKEQLSAKQRVLDQQIAFCKGSKDNSVYNHMEFKAWAILEVNDNDKLSNFEKARAIREITDAPES